MGEGDSSVETPLGKRGYFFIQLPNENLTKGLTL